MKIFKEKWADVDLSGIAELPSALTQWVTGEIAFDYDAAEGLTEMMEFAYRAYDTGEKQVF